MTLEKNRACKDGACKDGAIRSNRLIDNINLIIKGFI